MTAYPSGEVLVEIERSGVVEGVHRGHLVVLDPNGAVRLAIGEVRAPMFPRSSLKPVQAVAMLRSGLFLAPEEVALASSSHDGEPMHIAGVQAMLATGGLDESDLECPPDLPTGEGARQAVLAAGDGPRRIYMNCSGKHAAMLRTCVVNDWPLSGYLPPTHPLQQRIAETIAAVADEPVAAIGVDGCGAPVFAISLTALARSFSRLATGNGADAAVAAAMRAYPALVGGTTQVSSRVMAGVPGVIVKNGAEGVFAAALMDGGALALKVDDGASRAADRVLVGALRRLGVDAQILDDLAEEPVLGGGARVGSVRLRPGVL
ncbi:MAG TPA: asparaginase [Jatrophihabitantaceae bacterium]|nr:asparaginase [Jatrophihabitantaceae bacterium]